MCSALFKAHNFLRLKYFFFFVVMGFRSYHTVHVPEQPDLVVVPVSQYPFNLTHTHNRHTHLSASGRRL
jgi:hypothetical protein